MDEALYDRIAQATVAVYTDNSDTCLPSNCPRAEFIGCVVRFPGNDMESYPTEDGQHFGGADGCWENSRGLFECSSGNVLSLLDAYRDVCSRVSLGDFAVIAAEALMAFTATSPTEATNSFKKNFMWGRSTRKDCGHMATPKLKKLPKSATGCERLTELYIDRIYSGYDYPMTSIRSSMCTGTNCTAAPFAHGKEGMHEYKNMSKAWYLTAAISGMRTMALAKSPKSGKDSLPVMQDSLSFDNGYLKTMLSDGPRFDNGYYKAMVNAGVSERPCRLLCADSPFPWEKKCTWGLTCSGCAECDASPALALSRTAEESAVCDAAKFLQPHALAVQQFAKDEGAWLQAFMEGWWVGTTNAQGGLHFLMPPTSVPAKASKCGRLRKKDRCAHLGCAWNGKLCTGGVELSWGVKWNELHMMGPMAPKSQPVLPKPAAGSASEVGIVPDWQPPSAPLPGPAGARGVVMPPPPPSPKCSTPLVDRITHNAIHVGQWGGKCLCESGQEAWVGDVAPDFHGNVSEISPNNASHDAREPDAGAACIGGVVTEHHKGKGPWSHTMMQCGVCMDACDEPVPREDVYNELDMTVGTWGGRCMCPSGNIFMAGAKADGTMACKNGIADMFMEHGGPWSHKSVVCHPCPAPGWVYTCSWGEGVPGVKYTDGWRAEGPNGTHGFPPTTHPPPGSYSCLGSNNALSTGRLTVLSSETRGWTLISFSGARVTDVEVLDGKKGVALAGQWDEAVQQWTVQLPDPLTPGQPDELTVNASWTVIVHVGDDHAAWGTADDVDAHFECVDCFLPYDPDWVYTCSWGEGVPGVDYTDGWRAAGPNGTHGFPPTTHPPPGSYSCLGSNNTKTTGRLTVLSSETRGWTLISFSGAR
jgi:hypothetical protein